MSDLTLGQTVARDAMTTIAFIHGMKGGRYLGEMAQLSDERAEVFYRIADAIDRHAEALRHTLEGRMMHAVETGALGDGYDVHIDFEGVLDEVLTQCGLTEDAVLFVRANMPKSIAPDG